MSVTIIIRFPVESITHALRVMESNRDALERISRTAKRIGAIHHTFYIDTNASTLIAVDEWESKEAFNTFFGDNAEIQDIMEQAGVRGTGPDITILEPAEVAGTF